VEADSIFVPRPDVGQMLEEAVQRCEAGAFQVLWLFGETGQGKTFFLRRAIESMTERAICSYAGCSSPLGNQSTTLLKPYQPLKDLLEELLTSHMHSRRRINLIKNISLTVLACIPIVGDLAYGIKEIRRDWSEFKKGEREIDFRDFVEGYFDTLDRLSEEAPVMLVIDDVQWADKQTLNALSYFFSEKKYAQKRIVYVFAGRFDELLLSADAIGLYTSFSQSPQSRDVQMPPFTPEQTRAYYQARFPRVAPDPDLLFWLQQKTGGNPFFIQSYIQHLQLEGILSESGKVEGNLYTYQGMPAEIKLVNSWLMKALSEEEQNLLLTASILGYEFSLHELAYLMHAPAVDLIRKLRKIKTHFGIVEPIGYKLVSGKESTVFRFSQHAIHTALYNELTAEEREVLHRETAQYLNQLRATSNDDPDVLNSLASALMLHARLGRQPEIEYESILLKARNTPEALDDDTILQQLQSLAPSLGMHASDLEQMYRRALQLAPLLTHTPKGEHAVLHALQLEEEDSEQMDGLSRLFAKLLRQVQRERLAEAQQQAEAFILRQQNLGQPIHPLLYIMQALVASSRGEPVDRLLVHLHKASNDSMHPTYAAIADIGLALFHPDADEEVVIQSLRRVSAYQGRHRALLQRLVQHVLLARFGTSPLYADIFMRLPYLLDSPDMLAKLASAYPKAASALARHRNLA
jgi:predicted ATPase